MNNNIYDENGKIKDLNKLKIDLTDYFNTNKFNFIARVSVFGSSSINRDKLSRRAKNYNYYETKNKENKQDLDLLMITYPIDFTTKLIMTNNLNTFLNVKTDILYLNLEYYNNNKNNPKHFLQELKISEELIYNNPNIRF